MYNVYMKRVGLLFLLCMFVILPCNASSEMIKNESHLVFVYHIPDEVIADNIETETDEQIPDIVSDDITADTSGIPCIEEDEESFSDESDDYLISDLYSDVLKGYASYDEGEEEDGIGLSDLKLLTLNIKQPVKVEAKPFSNLKTGESLYENIYTRFNGSEYEITPVSNMHTSKNYGGFTTGTSYEQEISYGELEQTSGVFSRYEYKRFALTTSYAKTVNTTNNNYNDKFSFAPEVKLNQYLTLKNKFSADTVKKRKKAEVILSVNPFGKRDYDRLKFDFGASETYDEVSNTFWNRFEFNTTFKL